MKARRGRSAARLTAGRIVWRSIGTAIVAGFAVLVYSYLTLPDVRSLRTTNPSSTAFMELRAREARANRKPAKRVQRWMPYGRISPSLSRAVLVAEDDAFWQHEGVDFDQIQESLEVDWARGRFVRGASTITQQLAKNLYLSPSRSPLRKFRELIIARRLEAELTKARILEIYLNVIEWGDGVYGADAAARTYFSTPASSLGPSQAALLAGAIVNPRVLSPARPTSRLLRRQQLILRRMGAVSPPPPETPPLPRAPEPAEPQREEPGDPAPVTPDEPQALTPVPL
jgi:monofunctional biosynthetic peptidoglycan transglycosylase